MDKTWKLWKIKKDTHEIVIIPKMGKQKQKNTVKKIKERLQKQARDHYKNFWEEEKHKKYGIN